MTPLGILVAPGLTARERTLMVRYAGIALAAMLVLMNLALAVPPAQAAEGIDRIGTVRGDTLFVTVERVIDAALERNEMLAASGAMKDAASADAVGAWQGFLPQVHLGEYYLRSDDALSSFGFKLQNRGVTMMDFNPAILNQPGETDQYITRLQLLQPIFNGGMGWYGKGAANAASRAAEFEHRRAEETVRFQAHQAVEGLRLALAYTRVMETAVTSAEGHVQQARSMVRNEMATEADLLQAEVYLSGLRQRLIETRNMADIAGQNIQLLTATECPLAFGVDESTTVASDQEPVPAPDRAAVSERSDLIAHREKADAAGKMVGVARGAVLPHVNLSLQRDYFDHEDLFGTNSKSWSLGVYATMGLGVGEFGQIKKARAQHRAARHLADFESRQAHSQAHQAWLQAESARQKVLVARDAVAAAREGLRIVQNQYREGLASMVDLLDTQAAATMAEGNLVQARHDYRIGLARLEFDGAPRVADSITETIPSASADQ